MTSERVAREYNVTGNYDGKSADSRRKERRHQLIETAIRLIGRQGYASASLNAICTEAGLGKRYFYESFESVDELLVSCFHRIAKELQNEVIACIASEKLPQDMISAGFRAFFEFIQAHPERGRVFLIEALSVHASRGELFGGGGDVLQFLMSTTQLFLKDRRLPDAVMAQVAQGAVGAAIFIGQNWISSDYQQPIDELVQAVSEICFGVATRLNIPLDVGL